MVRFVTTYYNHEEIQKLLPVRSKSTEHFPHYWNWEQNRCRINSCDGESQRVKDLHFRILFLMNCLEDIFIHMLLSLILIDILIE